jgi:hypothetical protein
MVGALPVGPPTAAEVALTLAVALLSLPVRWLGGRVVVGSPGAQRLRHPPFGDSARTVAVGVLLGLPLAVGAPLAPPSVRSVRNLAGMADGHSGSV